jgi:hypothetical protein
MVKHQPPAAEARVGLLHTPIYTSRDLSLLVMPLEVAVQVKLIKTDLLPGQAIGCFTRVGASVLCGVSYKCEAAPSPFGVHLCCLKGEDPLVRHFPRSHR